MPHNHPSRVTYNEPLPDFHPLRSWLVLSAGVTRWVNGHLFAWSEGECFDDENSPEH